MKTLEAKGHNGTLVFDGRMVTIRREGFFASTSIGRGEKRIPVKNITAVQWKEPGAVIVGFIEFTVPGGNEARSRFGNQSVSASDNENAVIIRRKHADAFRALRVAIEDAIAA